MAAASPAPATTKRKHETLTLVQKLEILRKVDSGMTYSEIARQHNVGRSTVYDIRKDRNKIENYIHKTKTERGLGERQTMKRGKYPQLDEALFAWFLQERRRNKSITSDTLRFKALDFYEKIYKNNAFNASEGWLFRFVARFGIRLQTVHEEKLEKQAAASHFIKVFMKKIEELDLAADQVYNADESELFWRLIQNKTHDPLRDTSSSDANSSITIMPCSNATGRHKLKLLVIGQPKIHNSSENTHLPVIYRSQGKIWLTKGLFNEWFHNYFVPEVKKFLKSQNLPERALLILNNSHGYGSKEELSSSDGLIHTIFLPAVCASQIQPMRQGIIQTIKRNYKKKTLLYAISRDTDISELFKQMSVKDAMFTASDAWEEIGDCATKSSWQNLLPSLKQDDDPWEEEDLPLYEIIPLATTPNAGLTRADVESWFEETPELYDRQLSDDEIINKFSVTIESTIHDSVLEAANPTYSEDALHCVDKCINWALENRMPLNMMTNLRKMRDQVIRKIFLAKKEVKLEKEPEPELIFINVNMNT